MTASQPTRVVSMYNIKGNKAKNNIKYESENRKTSGKVPMFSVSKKAKTGESFS